VCRRVGLKALDRRTGPLNLMPIVIHHSNWRQGLTSLLHLGLQFFSNRLVVTTKQVLSLTYCVFGSMVIYSNGECGSCISLRQAFRYYLSLSLDDSLSYSSIDQDDTKRSATTNMSRFSDSLIRRISLDSGSLLLAYDGKVRE